MHFMYQHFIKDSDFENKDPIQLTLSRNVCVVLRRPDDDERKKIRKIIPKPGAVIVSETNIQRTPAKKNTIILDELSQDKIPAGVKDDLYLRFGGYLALQNFPEYFIQFCEELDRKVEQIASGIYGLIRWRFNANSDHYPLVLIDKYWSTDTTDWKRLPRKTWIAQGWTEHSYTLTSEDCELITNNYSKNLREPLAHELFREAWAQRWQNRRSSIVMGVAALETGIKSFISAKIPNAKWLLDEIQSPPVHKMLTEFLPTLLKTADGESQPIPAEIIEGIRNGVYIRNQIVHGKSQDIEQVKLEQILGYVRWMLYMLDYYLGHDWAIEHSRRDPVWVSG